MSPDLADRAGITSTGQADKGRGRLCPAKAPGAVA